MSSPTDLGAASKIELGIHQDSLHRPVPGSVKALIIRGPNACNSLNYLAAAF